MRRLNSRAFMVLFFTTLNAFAGGDGGDGGPFLNNSDWEALANFCKWVMTLVIVCVIMNHLVFQPHCEKVRKAGIWRKAMDELVPSKGPYRDPAAPSS